MKWSGFVFLLLQLVCGAAPAQKQIRVSSPDGRITFSFGLIHATPVYSVAFKGRTVIENSEFGFSYNQKEFKADEIGKPISRQGIEQYELVVGKRKK